MGDELTKYIETSLKYRLGLLTEAPNDDSDDSESEDSSTDGNAEPADDGEDSGDDIFSQDDIDTASKSMGGDSEGGDAGNDDQAQDGGDDAKDSQETAPMGNQQQSDQQKVQELYTDVGDPKVDYSLTSDSNVRLARFKFKYSGIDPITLMSDDDINVGVRVDELESRLTPDQYLLYKQKNHELRIEFPAIAERERKVIIYNSNIPIFYNDENGVSRIISNKRDLSHAIDKIEKFMNKSFGEDWVDNKKAVDFLQNIKINFSDEKKIRPNLIPISYFEPVGDKGIIAFNKLFAKIPKSIDSFIKNNIDSEKYKKSPLFRTIVNDYSSETGDGSARISIYQVIKNDKEQSSDTSTSDDSVTDDSETTDDSGATDDSSDAEGATGEEDSSGGI